MMRRFFLPLLLVVLTALGFCQDVEWKARLEPSDARPGEAAMLVLEGKVAEGLEIYGLAPGKGGTALKAAPTNPGLTADGGLIEASSAKGGVHKGDFTLGIPVRLAKEAKSGEATVKVSYQTVPPAGEEAFPPLDEEIKVKLTLAEGEARPDRQAALTAIPSPAKTTSPAVSGATGGDESLGQFILLAIAAGLTALLTPCVFPMIPVTVSYFTKRAETNPGQRITGPISYCVGIISAFVVVGLAVAAIFGGFAIQSFAANPWTNLILGLLFVVLAINLFGVYEIQLPGWLVNNVSKGRSKGGLVGPFMMGLAFALTSFTCTLGFVGGLLGMAANGTLLKPIVGMFFFGLFFSLPFFLLALMPDAIKKLPRSGAWMTTVKAFMGFLELAAAFKFFQQADIAWGAGLFTKGTFLASWSIIFFAAGLFMMGWMVFPHEASNPIGTVRRFFGVACLALGAWFVAGIGGLSMGELNAYLPPDDYHGRWETKRPATASEEKWHDSVDEAFKVAKETKQNVFIDFTGFNCVNCRWMEANVFPETVVQEELKKMVLVKLYTDRPSEPYVGNSKYQEKLTGTYSLPVYAIVTPEGELLAMHKDMERNVEKYLEFLKKGTAK